MRINNTLTGWTHSMSVLVVLVASILGGCSFVGSVKYYSPSTTEGELRTVFPEAVDSHGPANELILARAGGRVWISVEEGKGTVITAGPLFLPVIPAWGWFHLFQEEVAWDQPGLTVNLYLENWPEALDYDLGESVLMPIGEGEIHTASGVVINRNRVQVRFERIDKEELDAFDLLLGEIRVAGQPLSIPRIRFTKARGTASMVLP
jgi:hypothetical protein